MKTFKLSALALLTAGALSGCKTESQDIQHAKEEKATIQEVVESTEVADATAEKASPLRAKVKISGDNEAAMLVALYVNNAIADEMGLNGILVTDIAKIAGVVVSGNVSVIDSTKRGDRMALRGLATISMYRRLDLTSTEEDDKGDLITAKTFEAKSAEAYTTEEALQKLGLAFNDELRKWIKEKLISVKIEITENKDAN